MSEQNNENHIPTAQKSVDKEKITCHLVKLPKIVLTRIDDDALISANISSKKPVKRLGVKKNKTNLLSKSFINTILKENKTGKRVRGRPKRLDDFLPRALKPEKKLTKFKADNTPKVTSLKRPLKESPKPQNAVKSMLKKTMLQKKSKIAIPPAKRPKLIPTKPNKPALSKQKKQHSVVDTQKAKTVKTDSSEDEFLYDELIEELESTPMKKAGIGKPVSDKTTNITLKPSLGNKPPTIVKGGIIKKTNLPADLKPAISPIKIVNHKETKTNAETKPVKNKIKAMPSGPEPKIHSSPETVGSTKKASPWPVTISSSLKKSVVASPSKTNKKVPKLNAGSISNNSVNTLNPLQKLKDTSKLQLASPTDAIVNAALTPVKLEVGKPKIGPKQTAKVTPLSKPSIQDDNLSDEYTEEETLENVDSEPTDDISKHIVDLIKNKEPQDNDYNMNASLKTNATSFGISKDDEDPHLDLLRILTDDSDEPIPVQPLELTDEITKPISNDSASKCTTIETELSAESVNTDNITESSSQVDEEHTVRTIYDLMNDISLQYPSWNLHILPETSAFCIAQVTKGRLGIPTLKKCIELDPNDYNAKVYIHQYHIKKFDGVYDSEESIIALIQEIDSIKA